MTKTSTVTKKQNRSFKSENYATVRCTKRKKSFLDFLLSVKCVNVFLSLFASAVLGFAGWGVILLYWQFCSLFVL